MSGLKKSEVINKDFNNVMYELIDIHGQAVFLRSNDGFLTIFVFWKMDVHINITDHLIFLRLSNFLDTEG